MMKTLATTIAILAFPAQACAGADRLEPLPDRIPDVSSGFELPLHGERLPDEHIRVGHFEIDPFNETEEVVITQYSGEGDCCTDLVVFTNTLDGWKSVDFSWGLVGGSKAEDFIKDIDGDGTNEIVIDKIYRIEDGIVSQKDCEEFALVGPDHTVKRCTGQ